MSKVSETLLLSLQSQISTRIDLPMEICSCNHLEQSDHAHSSCFWQGLVKLTHDVAMFSTNSINNLSKQGYIWFPIVFNLGPELEHLLIASTQKQIIKDFSRKAKLIYVASIVLNINFY